MIATVHCWWCGYRADVDTSTEPNDEHLIVSNGMERDDSTMDGSESWICADSADCIDRARARWPQERLTRRLRLVSWLRWWRFTWRGYSFGPGRYGGSR